MIKGTFKYLNNKYVYIILGFLLINLMIDDTNFFDQYNLYRKTEDLKSEIARYQKLIDANNRKLNELKTSPENLEKFAREEYFMKKKNEDIYILVEE